MFEFGKSDWQIIAKDSKTGKKYKLQVRPPNMRQSRELASMRIKLIELRENMVNNTNLNDLELAKLDEQIITLSVEQLLAYFGEEHREFILDLSMDDAMKLLNEAIIATTDNRPAQKKK